MDIIDNKNNGKNMQNSSFLAKLINKDLKKTLGSDDISPIELTYQEQKDKYKDWVGKTLNNKHDINEPFGKITAAWVNEDDGTTYVRMSTGDTEIGKDTAEKIKNGDITSVSAGWEVDVGDDGKILDKRCHHVAFTNKPVYEGMVIYGCASLDGKENVKKASSIVRTAGGVGIIPFSSMNAAIVVKKCSNNIQDTYKTTAPKNDDNKNNIDEKNHEHSLLSFSRTKNNGEFSEKDSSPAGATTSNNHVLNTIFSAAKVGNTHEEQPRDSKDSKRSHQESSSTDIDPSTGGLMEANQALRDTLPDNSSVSVGGEEFRKLITQQEENLSLKKRLIELEKDSQELQRFKVAVGTNDEETLKDIVKTSASELVNSEKKPIIDTVSSLESLKERLSDTEAANNVKSSISSVINTLKSIGNNEGLLVTKGYRDDQKHIVTTLAAASLDGDFRVKQEREKSKELEARMKELETHNGEIKKQYMELEARMNYFTRGNNSTNFQSGVHNPTSTVGVTIPSSGLSTSTPTQQVLATASLDNRLGPSNTFSRFRQHNKSPSARNSSFTPSYGSSSLSATGPSGGIFSSKVEKNVSFKADMPASAQQSNNTGGSISASSSMAVEQSIQQNTGGTTFKNPLEAMMANGMINPITANAKSNYKQWIKKKTMHENPNEFNGLRGLEASKALRESSTNGTLGDDVNSWASVLGDSVIQRNLYW